jgi:hypothetical protein
MPSPFYSDIKDAGSQCVTQLAPSTVRVLEAVRLPRRVRTERSIVSIFLGVGSNAEASIFDLAVRDNKASLVLWSLWWAGAMLSLLSLCHTLPECFIRSSILMLPLPLFSALVLSVDLVVQVLLEFETYLMAVLQLYVCYKSVRILGDSRAQFWPCFLPSMLVSSFIDAYPGKYRRAFSLLFFGGMTFVLLSWAAMLTFALCGPINDVTWAFFNIKTNDVTASMTSLGTLLAFCLRYFYISLVRKDELVIIMSPMRTVQMSVLLHNDPSRERSYFLPTDLLVPQISMRSIDEVVSV